MLSICSVVKADLLEDFRNNAVKNLNEFREAKGKDLEDFRRRINEEIAVFMSQPWKLVKSTPELEIPVDPPPVPIKINMDTMKQRLPRPLIINKVINIPLPPPQPQPVEPILEIEREPEEPVTEPGPFKRDPCFETIFYGTKFSFRTPDLSNYQLKRKNPNGFADAWRLLNNINTNNLIIDCLAQREEKALCDWAYLKLVQLISSELFPENSTSATLLAGFIMLQSGYRVRFATDGQNRLHLLYSPTGIVYNVPSIYIDGFTYYLATEYDRNDLNYKVCDFMYPGEKQLSFEISRTMLLDYEPSETRNVTVYSHPDIKISVTTNRNLIDFYDTYPAATIDKNSYTLWAIYANTPVSDELRRDLYPTIKEAIQGKSQEEAANLLIHLAESFPYGYDSEIWGRDRAFFMDESWFYPLSDCEDHAINFTRLIRDILGLEAVLVYYPGHLASAVAFTDPNVEGDYVMHRGKKFIICDPTIFYANVGTTMMGFDNSNAILIDLMGGQP